jgi:hypothetical protein
VPRFPRRIETPPGRIGPVGAPLWTPSKMSVCRGPPGSAHPCATLLNGCLALARGKRMIGRQMRAAYCRADTGDRTLAPSSKRPRSTSFQDTSSLRIQGTEHWHRHLYSRQTGGGFWVPCRTCQGPRPVLQSNTPSMVRHRTVPPAAFALVFPGLARRERQTRSKRWVSSRAFLLLQRRR